jgi:hypothetical protein
MTTAAITPIPITSVTEMTVSNGLTLSTVTLTGTSLSYCYRLTDLYDAHTWTPVISYSSN